MREDSAEKDRQSENSIETGKRENLGLSRRKLIIKAGGVAVGALALGTGAAAALGVFEDESSASSNPNSTTDKQAAQEPLKELDKLTLALTETNPEVENAFKQGRLELINSGDWEKYFIPIKPDQVAKLLDITDASGSFGRDYRFILPFDPRLSTGLVVETVKKSERGQEQNVLVAKNIKSGTVFSSPFTGEMSLSNSNIGSVSTFEFVFDRETYERAATQIKGRPVDIALPITERIKVELPVDNVSLTNSQSSVEAGQNIGSFREKRRAFSSVNDSEFIVQIGRVGNYDETGKKTPIDPSSVDYDGALHKLLTFHGKIAFLSST